MNRSKFLISISVIVLLGMVIAWVTNELNKRQAKNDVLLYLPSLKDVPITNARFIKLYADPSYVTPYNVLLRFKVNPQKNKGVNVVERLGLKSPLKVDSVLLKETTLVDEYKYYFTPFGINFLRIESIKRQQNKVRWWNGGDCHEIFASPYLDKNNKKQVVNFGESNNGRIFCCQNGDTYYILIECRG